MRVTRTVMALTSALAIGLTACGTSTSGQQSAEAKSSDKPVKASSEAKPSESAKEKEGGEVDEASLKGDGSQTVYLVSKGFQHRFWQAVKQGAEEAGKKYNYKVEFVGPQKETQVTEQLNMLQTALDSKPAAIGFAALNTDAASALLEKIKEAKIPLVAFDSGVDSDLPVTTVATDNFAAAADAGKHLSELINGKGKVGLICHDITSQTGKQRCNGFKDYLKKNSPDVTVLPEQIAGEVGKAANVAKSLLQANPDIVGLYGTNEAAATGAVQGAAEINKSGLKIVGFDSGEVQIKAIEEGKEAGAITQSPVKMGYKTVEAAIKAIHGVELPKKIDSGFAWYDKANINNPEIQENLYK